MESIVASWPGLLFLGVMTVLEFVSKCVPVLDEIVDSIMVWIVPFMSILGTLSTMGLVTMNSSSDGADATDDFANDDEGGRRLNASDGALLFLQIVLICFGIVLALSMHVTKMFVRLLGVGWLTGILTVVEAGWCITTVTMAVFIRQISIFLAGVMVVGAGYVVKKKWWDKRHEGEGTGEEGQQIQGGDEEGGTGSYHATDDKGKADVIPTAVATPV